MSHCILGAGRSSSVRASRAERDEVVGERRVESAFHRAVGRQGEGLGE
jgi:hypothetical protein